MPSIYAQHYTFIASQTKRNGDITKDILKFDNLGCVNTQIVFGNVQFSAQYQEDIVKKYIDYQNMIHRFKKTNPNGTLLTFQQYAQKFPIDAIDSTGVDPQLIKSTINPRIDCTFSKPVPEGTIMHIVTLVETEYKYTPFTKKVIKN